MSLLSMDLRRDEELSISLDVTLGTTLTTLVLVAESEMCFSQPK